MKTNNPKDKFNSSAETQLWRLNAIKEHNELFDLDGKPIEIRGKWKEGPPLKTVNADTYTVEYTKDKSKIGIYTVSFDDEIQIRVRDGINIDKFPLRL